VIFWVFFVPLNIFWAFPRFVFALKNIFLKKRNLPYRIGPSQRPDPTRLRLRRPGRPGPTKPIRARPSSGPGCRRHPGQACPAPRLYKRRRRTTRPRALAPPYCVTAARFAAVRTSRGHPRPLGGRPRRAARLPAILVAGGSPEPHSSLKSEPATMANRRRCSSPIPATPFRLRRW
jgi:hypothetical protein